jgi:hypothetical protein
MVSGRSLKYFEEHERDLFERSVKSSSGLASMWTEESYLIAMANRRQILENNTKNRIKEASRDTAQYSPLDFSW